MTQLLLYIVCVTTSVVEMLVELTVCVSRCKIANINTCTLRQVTTEMCVS